MTSRVDRKFTLVARNVMPALLPHLRSAYVLAKKGFSGPENPGSILFFPQKAPAAYHAGSQCIVGAVHAPVAIKMCRPDKKRCTAPGVFHESRDGSQVLDERYSQQEAF